MLSPGSAAPDEVEGCAKRKACGGGRWGCCHGLWKKTCCCACGGTDDPVWGRKRMSAGEGDGGDEKWVGCEKGAEDKSGAELAAGTDGRRRFACSSSYLCAAREIDGGG